MQQSTAIEGTVNKNESCPGDWRVNTKKAKKIIQNPLSWQWKKRGLCFFVKLDAVVQVYNMESLM